MKPTHVLRTELIGTSVEVNGLHGIVIDETKHMITIQDEHNRIKKFIKKNHTFTIIINNQRYEIKGEDIVLRPEERIKSIR